jgi:arsenate reductase-like glutaredoxin family protein
MDAHRLVPADAVPASRKLGREEAAALAKKARTVIVAKGKKVTEFTVKGTPDDEVVDAMLGPTGNLRAPTLRAGKTLIVGFNEDAYSSVLLG